MRQPAPLRPRGGMGRRAAGAAPWATACGAHGPPDLAAAALSRHTDVPIVRGAALPLHRPSPPLPVSGSLRVLEAGGLSAPRCLVQEGWLGACARRGAPSASLEVLMTWFADCTVCARKTFCFSYNVKGVLVFVLLNLRQSVLFPRSRWLPRCLALSRRGVTERNAGPRGSGPGSRNRFTSPFPCAGCSLSWLLSSSE